MDMVSYDSGPGDDRMILMGCAELLDGLAQADLWLADGILRSCRMCSSTCIPSTLTSDQEYTLLPYTVC